MGPALFENRLNFQASSVKWKTPALWIIDLFPKTNGIAFYLQDGIARTIVQLKKLFFAMMAKPLLQKISLYN
jgi:CxxC motif-containing protein (DUF1111 family)